MSEEAAAASLGQDAIRAAEDFAASVDALLSRGKAGDIPDSALRTIFTAAVKAYAARVEDTGSEPSIVDTSKVTATEGVTVACALIRAIDLNMFDVTMWYNRSGNNRV